MSVETKGDARRRYKALRESLAPDERAAADTAIAAQVMGLAEFAQADVVFSYLSVGAEVDTRRIIRAAWERGQMIAVPRCVPGSNLMRWHKIESFDGLECGAFGIEEPADNPKTLVEPPGCPSGLRAVALVPGYAFDARGFRLGYGGGFYDVFLPGFGGVSVGLCRNLQFSDCPLPCDAHDAPVNIVVTESRVVRSRPGREG